MFYKKRKLSLLLAGIFIAMIISCQKEEVPADVEAPQVSLEISGNMKKLYNEVTLSSTATDNGAVDWVEFYVDNESVAKVTREPYEVQWNTKEVDDGLHTLKAVAYDATGNKAETAREAVVNNTLLVMHNNSEASLLPEGEERVSWVYLSDKNGQVIGKEKQLIPGTTLRWKRPSGFYSDTIYLNRLLYVNRYNEASQKTYKTFELYTYTNFTIEEVTFKDQRSPASLGKIDITVENNTDPSQYYTYSTALPGFSISYTKDSNPVTYSVQMHEESEKGFSRYHDKKGERYYRMDDFQVGNSYSFRTSEYTAMEEHTTTSLPFEFDFATISTIGFPSAESEKSYKVDGVFLGNGIQEGKAFYVSIFPVYYSRIYVRTQNKRFYEYLKGKAPEAYTLPDFTINVTPEDRKQMKVSSGGTFDIAKGYLIYSEDNATESSSFTRIIHFSNQSGATYPLPEVPASLLERFPVLDNQTEYRLGYVMDNKKLTSYGDILKYWFTDTFTGPDYREYSSLYVYPENAGGRILFSQPEEGTQEELMEEDLKARGIFRF